MSFLSGIGKGSLSRIENGGNLKVLSLFRICEVLCVHPRAVFPVYHLYTLTRNRNRVNHGESARRIAVNTGKKARLGRISARPGRV